MNSNDDVEFKLQISCRPEIRRHGEAINSAIARSLRQVADRVEGVNNGEVIAIVTEDGERIGHWVFADPNAKFTLYWSSGRREVAQGETFDDAFQRSGYGAAAKSALSFYSVGDCHKFYWSKEKGEWMPYSLLGDKMMNEVRV